MKAQEKAKALIKKYESILSNFKQSDARRQRNYSKLCAIICVDEIISLCAAGLSETIYWENVKLEIGKL